LNVWLREGRGCVSALSTAEITRGQINNQALTFDIHTNLLPASTQVEPPGERSAARSQLEQRSAIDCCAAAARPQKRVKIAIAC
jgi:hypothetical protein